MGVCCSKIEDDESHTLYQQDSNFSYHDQQQTQLNNKNSFGNESSISYANNNKETIPGKGSFPSNPSFIPPNMSSISPNSNANNLYSNLPDYFPPIPAFNNDISASDSRACVVIADTKWNGPPSVKYVVGLDFGTTFSGFAVIQIPDKDQNPTDVFSFKDWQDQPPGYVSPKTPTVLNYKMPVSLKTSSSNKQAPSSSSNPSSHPSNNPTADDQHQSPVMIQWGWTAKFAGPQPYVETAECVKIALAYEARSLKGLPQPTNGICPKMPERMGVKTLISDYLRALYPSIIQTITTTFSVEEPSPQEIFFCFTIPVQWEPYHQKIMREAIFDARYIDSLESPHLTFCREPEAAAVSFFREYNKQFYEGSRALIVDCGGGTVDLFNCQIQKDGQISELNVADGGEFGGSLVDKHFFIWLRKMIGDDAFEDLENDPYYRDRYNDICSSWDKMKRMFRENELDWTSPGFKRIGLAKAVTDLIAPEFLENLHQGSDIVITLDDMRLFFEPAVSRIVEMVAKQLKKLDKDVEGYATDYLLLVGGFCSSPYLRQRILQYAGVQKLFRECPAIKQPDGAVLRGAAWIGFNQHQIRTRKAKKTLGIKSIRDFNPLTDLESEAMYIEDEKAPGEIRKCVYKRFHVIVAKGSDIALDSPPFVQNIRVYVPEEADNRASIKLEVFASEDKEPQDVTDQSCLEVGNLMLDVGAIGNWCNVRVEIDYGKLEIWVSLKNLETGAKVKTTLASGNIVLV